MSTIMQFFGWHWKTLTSAELSKRLMKMVMASSLPVALCVAITVALFLVDTSTSDYVEAPETSIVYCIAMALWVVVLLMTLLVLFYGLPEAYAGIFWEMLTTTTASRSSRSSSSSSSSSSSEQVKDNRLKQFKTAKQPPPFDEPMLVVDKDAAYTVLPKELGRDLVKRTKMKVTKAIDKSPFLKQHSKILRSPLMAKYCLDKNIQRQDLVGSGGFASVYHCVVLNCSNAGKRTWRTNQYVIKHMANKVLIPQEEPIGLPKKLPKEEEQPTSMLMTENKHQVRQQSAWHTNPKYRKLYLASKGLLLEAHLLATLNHPHIIKLHGISKGVFDNIAATGRTDGFFLVLPKLVCTLQDKIEEWRNDIGTLPDNPCDKSALYQNLFSRKKRRKQFMEESFKERLHMIMDVLKALEYLHDHRIIHRGG